VGYPQYPDAVRSIRSLLQARPKYQNLLTGSATKGFALTSKGKLAVANVSESLSGEAKQPSKKKAERLDDRTYTGSAEVTQIESSRLYQLWRNDQQELIKSYDIWSLLGAYPYTEKSTIRSIFLRLKQAATLSKREDIIDFLNWVQKDKYKHIFTEKGSR
jgi:hypothetical protein